MFQPRRHDAAQIPSCHAPVEFPKWTSDHCFFGCYRPCQVELTKIRNTKSMVDHQVLFEQCDCEVYLTLRQAQKCFSSWEAYGTVGELHLQPCERRHSSRLKLRFPEKDVDTWDEGDDELMMMMMMMVVVMMVVMMSIMEIVGTASGGGMHFNPFLWDVTCLGRPRGVV